MLTSEDTFRRISFDNIRSPKTEYKQIYSPSRFHSTKGEINPKVYRRKSRLHKKLPPLVFENFRYVYSDKDDSTEVGLKTQEYVSKGRLNSSLEEKLKK